MKTQFFRFILCSVIANLTYLNLVTASSTPREDGTHFCGVTELQLDNRRYARSLANLEVGEPRTVRMIYFLPNDRPYRADVVQRMKGEILSIQTFFADQMSTHGYGKKTFRVETDAQGEPIVHRVDGDHPDSYYLYNRDPMFDEIKQAFDLDAHIYLIVIDNSVERVAEDAIGIAAPIGKNAGWTLVPDEFSWVLVAHELGHAFGLRHDFRDGAYIMSYGPGNNRLSACAAEFLSVQPYFNSDTPIEEGPPPTVELISPRTYPAGSKSVSVRFKVSDLEGLHQVLLLSAHGMNACRGYDGEKDALAEFEFERDVVGDGDFFRLSDFPVHPIYVLAVDIDGNEIERYFNLAEMSPSHIATLPHGAEVSAVAFSPVDVTLLASGSWDSFNLWNVATQENIATFHENGSVHSMAFSRDGATLATGSLGGTIKLWDVVTQQSIATLPHRAGVHSVAFSHDGMTLATGLSDGTVKLWDVMTQQDIATLPHGAGVHSVAFSHDGMTLATGLSDGTVKLWDVVTQQSIATLPHRAGVHSVAFSHDGMTLATGSWDGTVKLWDMVTQQSIATLLHWVKVSSVAFSRDGATLASGGSDGTVKLWDMTTRANFATIGHVDRVTSVSFSHDGATLAAGTKDGTVELWDTSEWMQVRLEGAVEINIPDPNLHAAIAEASGLPPSTPIFRGLLSGLTLLDAGNANISDLTGLESATNLKWLHLERNNISDISAVSGLTNLKGLTLEENNISDISAVSGLTNLTWLYIWENNISDISPLVANAGLGNRDEVYVWENPLSYLSIYTHIPVLQEKGVAVSFGTRTPQRIRIVSGNDQQGLPGEALEKPLVVEVQDENGVAFEGVPLTFSVTGAGGTLSATSATTDSSGRAESILTLGPNPGTNTVTVSVTGVQAQQTFTSEGVRTPKTLEIISGDNQEESPGSTLENPFVVEVRDQTDKLVPGVQVTFSMSSGGGTLSATSATTDNNGRAESTLTLGPNPGTNTVTVSVTGIQEKQTFNAEGIRIPKTLEIFSGGDQGGEPGAALENPFVMEVRDQTDKPLPGVQVTFSVTSGGGALSATSVTTDSNGRAESILTLGPNPGTNTVTVSVTGITQTETFNAEGIRIPKILEIISGDDQEGWPGFGLAKPFVVEVRDQADTPVPGVQITFSVASGGGTLSRTSATTDSNGRAESALTLGPNPGTNTVTVSVTGITQTETFNAEGIRIPKTFEIISGGDQQGLPGAALANPFVAEVRDQSGEPLPSVQVTFSVSIGGGMLSATSVTTNSNGRAESILTLGPNPGTNTVTASVTGIQEEQTFAAEGIQIPKTLEIISGDNQEGLPGAALEKPFIVEVRDQSGDPLLGVQVTFSVTSGGGTLSVTSTTTGSDGRTESILTLGPNPGTNTVEVRVRGIQEKQSVSAIAELPPIPQDVNRDDVVNILDLVLVASVLGDEGQGLVADVNEDGIVNILDLVSVAGALGDVAAAPSLHPQALAMLTATDVGEWLAQAGELDLMDAMSNQGSLFLKQLLAALTPADTALLPNYPNPFNPETWIPYRLAEDSHVTMTIYDTIGVLVCRLDLGHQSAGFYESRSQAIYWDGRNDFGEGVASGVYFYHLSAGDYSATRKMLVVK